MTSPQMLLALLPWRHRRLRRPGRADPAGARAVPPRLRGIDPARPPRSPGPVRAGSTGPHVDM